MKDKEYLKEDWLGNAFKYGVKVLDVQDKKYQVVMWTSDISIQDEFSIKEKYQLNSIERYKSFYKLLTTNEESYKRMIHEGVIRIGTLKAKCETWIYRKKKTITETKKTKSEKIRTGDDLIQKLLLEIRLIKDTIEKTVQVAYL